MNSREYWKKQILKDKAASINRSERYITSTLSKCYREALKEIQQDIDKFYQSFADKNHITLAEAKRVISKKDFNEIDFIQLSKEQVKENQELKKRREQLPGEVFSEMEKKQKEYEQLLSAYTKKGEITRLELLQAEMEKELLHLSDRMQVNIYEILSSEYQNHYYKTVFQTQKGLGFGKSFAMLNTSAIQKAVLKTYHASSYSKRIWGHNKQLSKEFREQLTTGIIKGESIDKLTKRIAKRMEVSKSNAKRLVRTETAYVFEQAAKDAYEQCGIEEYEFLATLDLKTSKICQGLDTKVFKVRDAMPGTNYPPMHPNCRSTTVCHFEDDAVTTRTARGADKKTYEVPSNMSYQEWWNSLSEDDQGEMRIWQKTERNRQKDKKQFEKYSSIPIKGMPKKFSDFQKMKYTNPEKWSKIKEEKQAAINSMDFSEMSALKEKLGNKETRLWYKDHDKKIPEMINRKLSLEDQAKQASELRNQFRTQARDLMADQEERKKLDLAYPNLPFDYYIKKYSKPNEKGEVPTKEEVYKKIVEKSTTSNKKYDRKAGVEE